MAFDTPTATDSNEFDLVRNHTPDQVNREIDQKIAERVQQYSSQPEAIAQRLIELEREWDTERVLEANASLLAFTGLMLGLLVNHRWLWLTGLVLTFLFQHAIQGWCPPLPIIRRLGVRTRREIDWEKYALKCLRGDFDVFSSSATDLSEVEKVLQAVKF